MQSWNFIQLFRKKWKDGIVWGLARVRAQFAGEYEALDQQCLGLTEEGESRASRLALRQALEGKYQLLASLADSPRWISWYIRQVT